MDRMVRLLIERETIFTEDVKLLMEGKSVEEVRDRYDERMARNNSPSPESEKAEKSEEPDKE